MNEPLLSEKVLREQADTILALRKRVGELELINVNLEALANKDMVKAERAEARVKELELINVNLEALPNKEMVRAKKAETTLSEAIGHADAMDDELDARRSEWKQFEEPHAAYGYSDYLSSIAEAAVRTASELTTAYRQWKGEKL